MIRYYTYYSCGGYKDLYIGSDQDPVNASYFIPLLNAWKKSNKPENVDKIARAENVQHVELISKGNSAGFPTECNLMFSHGGYRAIYRTLSDGRTCLCIRDIPNEAKDEEGRDIPFNFMFLADSEESIDKLDVLALQYLSTINETNSLIASAITYEYVINGFKFDLAKLDSLFSWDSESRSNLNHRASYVDYLLVGSRNQTSLAVKEQGLDTKKVNAVFDSGRLIYGGLDYKETPSMVTNRSNSEDNSDDVTSVDSKEECKSDKLNPIVESEETGEIGSNQDIENKETASVLIPELTNKFEVNSTEPSEADEIKSEMAAHYTELKLQEILQKISSLASKDDIESLNSLINKLSKDSNCILDDIRNTLKTLQLSTELPTFTSEQNDVHILFSNRICLIAISCLIVGTVLGALIF